MSLSLGERSVPASGTNFRDALARALGDAVTAGGTSLLALPAPLAASEALLSHTSADALAWAAPGGFELTALGSAAVLEGHGATRFSTLGSAGRALLGAVRPVGVSGAAPPVPRLFGGFSFRPGPTRDELWHGFGEARFVLPELSYLVEGGTARLLIAAVASKLERPGAREELIEGVAQAQSALTRGLEAGPDMVRHQPLSERSSAEWAILVEKIRAEIARGALEKAVLARRVDVTLEEEPDPARVLFRLRREAPECTRFLFRHHGVSFLGATPERLARKRGDRLDTEAVAGSIGARQADAGSHLLGSAKDGAEHALVLREILRALGPLAAELEHAPVPELCELRHVVHLRTRITAKLRGSPHLLDVVERLHPTPAVGGVPTARALEWIFSHEPDDRGWYAGPVGWFDPAGDGEMAVALRSGVLVGKTAHLYVGSGIVDGSAPAAELTETRWKLQALLGALGVAE